MQGAWILIVILLLPFLAIPIILYTFFKHAGDNKKGNIAASSMPLNSDLKHPNGKLKNPLKIVSSSSEHSPLTIIFYVLAGGFIAGVGGFILGHSYGAWDAIAVFKGILRTALFMALGMVAGAVIWRLTRR